MAESLQASKPDEPIRVNFVIKDPTRIAWAISLVVTFIVFVRNAWIGDDAFITMRVVDNFVHGYGLVWNVGERVQAYTHPLWMLLLVPVYAVTNNPYLTLYGLSLVISMLVVGLLLTKFTRHYREALLVCLLLLASTTFVDFSFSGLENPLTNLLLVVLLLVMFRWSLSPGRRLFWVTFVASVAGVNRLDTILLFLPVIGYTLFEARHLRWKAALILLAGFLPLILWLGFATFYYGFPLPNTYYAKLKTGMKTTEFIDQGKHYFQNAIRWDPITLLTIGAAVVLTALSRQKRQVALAFGIVLYLAYILYSGGDFMSGRFFCAPFVVAVGILLTLDYKTLPFTFDRRLYWYTALAVVVLGLIAEHPPLFVGPGSSGGDVDRYGIADEKMVYYPQLGMLNQFEHNVPHDFAAAGLKAKAANETPVYILSVGSAGYYAGPSIYIIDAFVLADPLRARLPTDGGRRVGHYERRVPAGYQDSLAHHKNELQSPALRQYYDKLLMLTQGDLMAPGRWQEILNFNLGRYDGLIQEYMKAPDWK